MAAQMLVCFADRGGYERSYARATHGGDDFGGGVVARQHGDAAVVAGADGKPLGAWGVHPDEGAGGGGQAGVHPVAPGAERAKERKKSGKRADPPFHPAKATGWRRVLGRKGRPPRKSWRLYFGMISRASLLITSSRRSLRFLPASSMASREP